MTDPVDLYVPSDSSVQTAATRGIDVATICCGATQHTVLNFKMFIVVQK